MCESERDRGREKHLCAYDEYIYICTYICVYMRTCILLKTMRKVYFLS